MDGLFSALWILCPENLAIEREILGRLKPVLRMAIPDYVYVPEGHDDFAGCAIIPGTRLAPWRFRRLGKEAKRHAARDLGEFVSDLHAFPIQQARAAGVARERSQFEDARAWVEDYFARTRPELDGHSSRLFDGWLEDLRESTHEYSPVLAHNDLWHKHIYIDPDTGVLSGVIDWGDVAITDPAWDFFGFWAYGEPFVDSVLAYYRHYTDGIKKRSWDCFRLKVMMAGCSSIGRCRKYAVQLLSGVDALA